MQWCGATAHTYAAAMRGAATPASVLGLPPSRHAASATCQVVCCLMAEGMKRWRCVAKCPALLNRGPACWRSETFPPLHGRGALRSLPRTAPCSSPAVGCVSLLPPPPHQARAAAFRCRSRAAATFCRRPLPTPLSPAGASGGHSCLALIPLKLHPNLGGLHIPLSRGWCLP